VRQEGGQGTGGGRFCRSPFAADQYTADAGVDGIQNESAFHALLSNDGCKGKNGGHLLLQPVIIPPVE